jgi:hypothetical protein
MPDGRCVHSYCGLSRVTAIPADGDRSPCHVNSANGVGVDEYIRPEKFAWWADQAKQLGFSWVESSPFARSSYFAERQTTR